VGARLGEPVWYQGLTAIASGIFNAVGVLGYCVIVLQDPTKTPAVAKALSIFAAHAPALLAIVGLLQIGEWATTFSLASLFNRLPAHDLLAASSSQEFAFAAANLMKSMLSGGFTALYVIVFTVAFGTVAQQTPLPTMPDAGT
jgi:hypothetical protein